MKKVRLMAFGMALMMLMSVLSGCRSSSIYSDGSVDVPSTWATYTVSPLTFKFEAGYKSANWDELLVESDEAAVTSGVVNNLALFGRLQSPEADQGTVNYLDFGYFEMGHSVAAEDLEAIMNKVDELATSMKKLEVTSDELEAARIRAYGEDELEAMTCCYEVDYFIDQWTITVVVQLALVPHESRIYMIAYSDFTTGTDDSKLEQLLTTLSFEE